MSSENNPQNASSPPVYVVSGGVGASGTQLVHTALAQFPNSQVQVIPIGSVRQVEQIETALAQVQSTGGTIAHTLVDPALRQMLIERAPELGIAAIDLMGPLLARLSHVLGREPLIEPGLYRRLNKAYYDRVEAIEYSMAHDDGKDPSGWEKAELLLLGISRTGKTPLSLYLSVLGWKVANFPLVPEMEPPPALFAVDPSRVVGLTIEPGQLILHRQQRQSRLGVTGASPYVDPEAVYEEVKAAVRFFRKNGFAIVNVTDKPVESIADEVLKIMARASPGFSSASFS
jgi:[pyruvate, water dikinase]-phosphate phosphotransferase / [pyruvate, water dikinase] kinase